MPAAHARIETGRASRYLTQFCQHVQRIYTNRGPLSHARRTAPAGHTQGRPAEPPRVAWTDTHGTVTFGDATITLQAGPSAAPARRGRQRRQPPTGAGTSDGATGQNRPPRQPVRDLAARWDSRRSQSSLAGGIAAGRAHSRSGIWRRAARCQPFVWTKSADELLAKARKKETPERNTRCV
jgi:hypothetical protein